MERISRPYWWLIARGSNWYTSFKTGKELIEYLDKHGIGRDQLANFYVIHGEEKWAEILTSLRVTGGPLTGLY